MNCYSAGISGCPRTSTKCRDYCASTASCHAVDWDEKYKKCWVHQQKPGLLTPSQNMMEANYFKIVRCGRYDIGENHLLIGVMATSFSTVPSTNPPHPLVETLDHYD
jgi:hypothetical protein